MWGQTLNFFTGSLGYYIWFSVRIGTLEWLISAQGYALTCRVFVCFHCQFWWIEEIWLSALTPWINEQLLCWRWAIEKETVQQRHWIFEHYEDSSLVVPTTHLGEFNVKTLGENCIMESTVSFLDWNSLRAGACRLPLQAMLTQNLLSKPITGCSQSDIHKKFSILSFKWSFPLVTHACIFISLSLDAQQL